MSDLLNSASLVMIPSGYKEDTVFSQIPTDGSGDMAFTRASNGTRINSAGLVEVCPWNLCTYSEELNIWTTERASVTANATTAPNGTTTADKVITDSTANTTHQIYIGPFTTDNLPMVISAYAKKSEYNYLHLGAGGSSTKTWFDLNSGTVGTQSSDVLSASIESVGNGWYRCINVINNTSTSNYVEVGPASVDGSRVISGTPSGGVFVWGAQLNIGATAKPYFPTTDRLNVPRLTYQNGGGGCPSLLLEKQSTNYATYSEDFTQWTPSAGTITLNAGTSPDGTNNANLFTEDTTTGYHRFSNSCTGLTGTAKTFSIFAKWAGGTGRKWLTIDNGPMAFFDLENGVVGTIQGTGTGTMEAMGNGWYRCIYTNLNSAGGTMYVGTANANNGGGNHLGNGEPAYYCWGAQAE